MTPPTSQFVSIGNLAANLRRSVSDIAVIASNVGAEPAMTVNGVRYFNGEQCQRIITAAHELRSAPGGDPVANRAGIH